MKYIVYITHYKGTKLPPWYIGSTSKDKITNGYNGSVNSKKYKHIYKIEQKENKHLFKTRILSYHKTREEAYREENRLQRKHNVVNSNYYYNESYAQEYGFKGGDNSKYIDYSNPETKQKISEASKNYWNVKLGYKKEFIVNCSKCGTNFTVVEREKQFPKKEKYFCSKSCACSRPATKEANEKRKISNKKYNLDNNVKPTNNSKGTKYVNKCGIIKRVKPEFLKEFLENGWILGKK